jgi:hypothetical protein
MSVTVFRMKVFLCAVILLATMQACFEHPPAGAAPSAGDTHNSHWMQDHLDAWGNRPLKQWVLPASHDAAMYESGWVKSLARTQDHSIYDQLMYGVRYFDIRPQSFRGTLYLHHGPVLGPKLADVLDDVRRFCRGSCRELIILKFSRYEGFGDKVYSQMVKDITDRLDPWLYKSLPDGKRLAEIPLREMLRKKCALLVVCDGDYPLAHRTPGIWVYRDWGTADAEAGDLRVYDRYADSTDYERMRADQFDKFAQYDGKCRKRRDVACDLFQLCWTLTPATNVRAYSELPNRKLAGEMRDLKCPNRFGRAVNLLSVDYVESAHVTDVALAMNRTLETTGDKAGK